VTLKNTPDLLALQDKTFKLLLKLLKQHDFEATLETTLLPTAITIL